ncbi:putative 4-coumarate--CoA ligase [Rosa chinensis]|uniref:Putative 4-coumarate--CoA ligase n=1 Tax=Rosa chinensis TaxID=74649 RepID=A0A2P6QGX5_ROSCH|nr:putative 4-coumarate--CoA ligase [Rosa chinensis]
MAMMAAPLVLPGDPNLTMVSLLFKNSSSYPHKPALIDAESSETLSFSQFKSMVIKVAHGLIHLGIKKNDVVLIFAPSSIQFPICFLGNYCNWWRCNNFRSSLHCFRAFQAS